MKRELLKKPDLSLIQDVIDSIKVPADVGRIPGKIDS